MGSPRKAFDSSGTRASTRTTRASLAATAPTSPGSRTRPGTSSPCSSSRRGGGLIRHRPPRAIGRDLADRHDQSFNRVGDQLDRAPQRVDLRAVVHEQASRSSCSRASPTPARPRRARAPRHRDLPGTSERFCMCTPDGSGEGVTIVIQGSDMRSGRIEISLARAVDKDVWD